MSIQRIVFLFSCILLITRSEIYQIITKEALYNTMTCIEKHIDISKENNILFITKIKYYHWPINITKNSAIITTEVPLKNINYAKFDIYILLVNDFIDFNETLNNLIKSSYWNPRIKFLVAFNDNKIINEFFVYSWKYYITNINVITNVGNIYTYFPYKNGTCGQNVEYELISTCAVIVEPFPSKIPLNMKGCNIRVMAYPMIPYVIDKHSEKVNPSLSGLEVTIFNTLSTKMNFKEVYIPCRYVSWGFKDNSGKYQMMFKSLFQNETDIIMGMTYGNASHIIDFDGSYVYLMDYPIWWVPSALPLSRWKNLTAIFETYVWFSIFGIILLNGFVWWILGKNNETTEEFNSITLCIIYSLYTLLQGSILEPKTSNLRIVFIFWLITCVLLFTAHQSSLVSILTTPIYEHQISTLEELVQSKLAFGFYQGAANAFEDNNWIFREILQRYEACPLSLHCMNRTAFDRNFAFMRNRRNAQYFIPRYYTFPNGRPMVYQLDITGPGIWVRLHTTKGLPVLENINKYLMLLQSNGLIAKWDKDANFKVLKVESDPDHTALSISHLQGAFYIFIIGEILSFVVFISELLYSKYNQYVSV